jgi:hypothetical protein
VDKERRFNKVFELKYAEDKLIIYEHQGRDRREKLDLSKLERQILFRKENHNLDLKLPQ